MEREHNGKIYSVIIGWPGDGDEGSEDQSYRYHKDTWTEAAARKHCEEKKGTFEPLKKEEDTGAEELIGGVENEMPLRDFEYLLHHVEIDKDGKERIHHCFVYDHIANLFEQGHLLIKAGKAYLDGKEIKDGLFHIIKELEPTQEVAWSNEEARNGKIRPKEMISGMKLKEKAKEW